MLTIREGASSGNENHWVAIIVDHGTQKIFFLDPAAKPSLQASLSDDIKRYIDETKYQIIFNIIDCQISEKDSEYGLIHCGPYTVQIFEEFKRYVENDKTETGEKTIAAVELPRRPGCVRCWPILQPGILISRTTRSST